MFSSAHGGALDREGYVVVADVLPTAQIERLRAAFGEATRGTEHVRVEGAPGHEAWAALREHPLVRAAADAVLADASFVRDLHGRNPTPGFGQQGLHADWPERDPNAPFSGVTLIWILDAFTPDNGATRVVPGTHRGRGVPREMAQPAAHHRDERIIIGDAGSVLVMNGHVWHSGTMNRSAGARRAAQMIVARR